MIDEVKNFYSSLIICVCFGSWLSTAEGPLVCLFKAVINATFRRCVD